MVSGALPSFISVETLLTTLSYKCAREKSPLYSPYQSALKGRGNRGNAVSPRGIPLILLGG